MSGKTLKGAQGQLPTPSELRLLQILWELGETTVEGILDAHPAKERPNYKTVQTLLRIMERKQFIEHEIQGRAFVFKPVVSRKTIDRKSVQALLSQNFRGSAAGLLLNLLEAAKVKGKDLDALEAQIKEYRGKKEQAGQK
jgi:BlaI family transcriptional regulator, penicillinase repressor